MTDSPPSILAVEDNLETQLLLQHLLQPLFCLVVTGTADDALRAAQAEPFDMFLLDINLGSQETGVDLLHQLRATANTPNVPAVALTAYAMPGDREHFIDAGFDAYVSKPFTRDELTSVIESTLSAV